MAEHLFYSPQAQLDLDEIYDYFAKELNDPRKGQGIVEDILSAVERIAAVREILSIPDGYMPLNVIPVGYPAENPPAKDKWNPAKIHYAKW